jgi:hypothetical protein
MLDHSCADGKSCGSVEKTRLTRLNWSYAVAVIIYNVSSNTLISAKHTRALQILQQRYFFLCEIILDHGHEG